jgi:hypothetical protein
MSQIIEKQIKLSKGFANLVVRHEDILSYLNVEVLDDNKEPTGVRGMTSCSKKGIPAAVQKMIKQLAR